MSTDALSIVSRWRAWLWCAVIVLSSVTPAFAQQIPPNPTPGEPFIAPTSVDGGPNAAVDLPANSPFNLNGKLPDISSPENFSAAMQMIILLTVLSLAPAILIMMTSFTRMIIVLSLLRQALGTQSLPPNQILIGLAMFMTFLVMGPTMQKINETALQPYMDGQMDQKTALSRAVVPMRDFMIKQIVAADNDADVDLFADFAGKPRAESWDDVGTMTLIPAFVLSELKTAFILGFKVYLPFLIIDMVISTVLISMGMMMLPPAMISLPFKLLLFVLVDGWHLITQRLMGSFVA
ncbi:MAG TPA: flagellar type III secretion system pore protein FliP [Tepidisphaeraceae bacterium]|nr:flagellar type III secretion system pore protein FliP [Tepidisphaeraceae bacterium]